MISPPIIIWKFALDDTFGHHGNLTSFVNIGNKVQDEPGIDPTKNGTDAKADKAAEADGQLQDSLTCRNIVNNLVFSNWYKGNQPLFGNGSFAPGDTAYTTSGRSLTNMQDVLDHTVAVNEMSNGVARTIDQLTFSSWNTYNPRISVIAPEATMKVTKLTAHSIPLESLAGRDSLFSKVPRM